MASARFSTLNGKEDFEATEEEETLLGRSTTSSPVSSRKSWTGKSFSKYRGLAVILKDLVLLALTIPALVILFQHAVHRAPTHAHKQSPSTDRLPGCNCGTSIAQALTLHCKYDTLAAAWLPPHCRDDELTELFNHSGDGPNGTWTYWADQEHTREMTVEQVGALADLPEGGEFYATHQWHLVHCMFYWRKAVRSRTVGVTMEQRYDTESHVTHCSKMMFDEDGSRGATSGVALNSNRWDAM